MTSDSMVRVGRGGAGNYHSAPVNKKDASGKSQVAGATQPASAPALTGRGGAGNILSGSNAVAHTEGKERLNNLEAIGTAAASNHDHNMLAGRGGAGNWRDTRATREDEDEDAARDAEARRAIVAHVNFELRRPEPTHTRVRHSERRLQPTYIRLRDNERHLNRYL
ncbi:hypothetical protein ISF_00836 [Cordyceps fumosorosea ARSEF 2679]|uniref:Uncharacterized protein n=1 Tax=Cordyceps fumosorosea (strain ARSEF 2679) TaxID=1081104 RepID=A0A168EL26_CORFA|nr:hypothetical protein ISF_00836 [Cordyceps fumosorosea ARSEF 2679]OAA73935.1 hypothetical protein ISF_00836 [Cordyceps fumosorosea ARSEF 2679]